MPKRRIYLDHAATTPVDVRVIEAMQPYWSEHFGNTSSIHSIGREALQALDDARQTVAEALHCQPARSSSPAAALKAITWPCAV